MVNLLLEHASAWTLTYTYVTILYIFMSFENCLDEWRKFASPFFWNNMFTRKCANHVYKIYFRWILYLYMRAYIFLLDLFFSLQIKENYIFLQISFSVHSIRRLNFYWKSLFLQEKFKISCLLVLSHYIYIPLTKTFPHTPIGQKLKKNKIVWGIPVMNCDVFEINIVDWN